MERDISLSSTQRSHLIPPREVNTEVAVGLATTFELAVNQYPQERRHVESLSSGKIQIIASEDVEPPINT